MEPLKMHSERSIKTLLKAATVLALGTALMVSPSLAANNSGNGHGKAESKGNSSSSQNSTESESSSSATTTIPAELLGKLNGFMHASPRALAHASPKSEIGKVAIVYAGLLESYLSPTAGTTPPTLQQVADALVAASNKPPSAAIIAAINAKLASVNPALATSISAYKGGASALASAIAALT